MSATVTPLPKQFCSFRDALDGLVDPSDARGKRHELVFVVAAVVLAILSGRSRVSRIHRFIRNRLQWLIEITGQAQARVISRAPLPRLLARLDWVELNALIEHHFDGQLECNDNQEWVAIDGKVLRGVKEKQALVLAVSHNSRALLAQVPMKGHKASEITVVRGLLKDHPLEAQKVSLDAHHCTPKTTARIHQAGGEYVIRVKNNQPKLLAYCQRLSASTQAQAANHQQSKGHGRHTTREGQGFAINASELAPRWADSGIATLITLKRHTHTPVTGKTSLETAYYISNRALDPTPKTYLQQLTQAIRQHWHVESENWIRDVTFNEDHVKTVSSNQGQIMGSLRGLAVRLLRKANISNFQEVVENFTDCPSLFENFLIRVNFL